MLELIGIFRVICFFSELEQKYLHMATSKYSNLISDIEQHYLERLPIDFLMQEL